MDFWLYRISVYKDHLTLLFLHKEVVVQTYSKNCAGYATTAVRPEEGRGTVSRGGGENCPPKFG